MAQFARQAAGDQNVTVLRAARGHGTRMLVFNKGLMDSILEWVDTPVKAPELDISSDTLSGIDGSTTTASPDPVEQDPSLGD